MAEVRLGRYELERKAIPALCMRCGAPAQQSVSHTFSWRRDELISIGNPAKKMTVEVPLCDRHQSLWSRRVAFNLFMLVLLIGIVVLFFLLSRVVDSKDATAGGVCFGSFILIVVWLVVNMAFDATLIKPTEISENAISLKGVSEEFVAELDRMRGSAPK